MRNRQCRRIRIHHRWARRQTRIFPRHRWIVYEAGNRSSKRNCCCPLDEHHLHYRINYHEVRREFCGWIDAYSLKSSISNPSQSLTSGRRQCCRCAQELSETRAISWKAIEKFGMVTSTFPHHKLVEEPRQNHYFFSSCAFALSSESHSHILRNHPKLSEQSDSEIRIRKTQHCRVKQMILTIIAITSKRSHRHKLDRSLGILCDESSIPRFHIPFKKPPWKKIKVTEYHK